MDERDLVGWALFEDEQEEPEIDEGFHPANEASQSVSEWELKPEDQVIHDEETERGLADDKEIHDRMHRKTRCNLVNPFIFGVLLVAVFLLGFVMAGMVN